MDNCEKIINSGLLERGRIIDKENNKYRISSLDREGIETGWVITINDSTYDLDDYVYFFSFRDGTGAILCTFTKG